MLKTNVTIILGSCLLSAPFAVAQQREVAELASILGSQFAQRGRKVIAVAKFTNDDDYDDRFSRFLVSQLTTQLALVASGTTPLPFKVVDRAKIDAVLNELNLQYAKPFDAATFARFGTGTGADTIIAGDFRVTTNRLTVNCIALNTSMEVVGGKIFDIPRTAEMDEYLGKPQPTSRSGLPAARETGQMTSAQRKTTAFENGFLRAELISASISSDGQLLSIAFSIQNLLKEDLYLAFASADPNRPTKIDVIDDQSTGWKPEEIRGIQLTQYAGPGGYPRLELLKERCTMISPGDVITVALRFTSSTRSDGKLFTLTAEGFRYDLKSPTHFSIGLRNFPIQTR
jgi:hypothetical protein